MSPDLVPAGAARILAALLDRLAARGDAAGRERVLRAAGLDEVTLRSPGARVDAARLRAAWRGVPVDRRLARQVGRDLAAEEARALALRRAAAGPERALRRGQGWLPREWPGARYRAVEVGDRRARIVFEPGEEAGAPEGFDASFCGLREGMLEVLPLLYGLPAARVEEERCRGRGDAACCFQVVWWRAPRSGLVAGAAAGALGGAALGLAAGAGPAAGAGLSALLAVLAAGSGHALDLRRRLAALAGRRRLELGMADEAERSLSATLDRLATLGGSADASSAAIDLDARDVDLAQVARRAIAACSVPGGVPVSLEVRGPGTRLYADAARLERMLIQLLRRALEASEADATSTPVALCLEPTPAAIEVCVEDGGAPLDEDAVESLFDPFGADEPAADASQSDVGSGLRTVRRLRAAAAEAEAHGGSLGVEARPGAGARIRVHLPRREPAGPAAAPGREAV